MTAARQYNQYYCSTLSDIPSAFRRWTPPSLEIPVGKTTSWRSGEFFSTSDKPVCSTATASHPGNVHGPAKIPVSDRNT
jgi:hypothetical protein